MISQERLGRLVRAAAGAGAIALFAGACEGSNLFEGEVADEPPRITGLVAPAFVDVGSTLTVDVTAVAQRGVSFVEIRYTGAATDTDRIGFDGTDAAVLASSVLTLLQAADSLLFIEAVVEDVGGRISAAVRDTVRVRPSS
jgi:hypothetical protein